MYVALVSQQDCLKCKTDTKDEKFYLDEEDEENEGNIEVCDPFTYV
jgi:hypothetical protein